MGTDAVETVGQENAEGEQKRPDVPREATRQSGGDDAATHLVDRSREEMLPRLDPSAD